MKAFIVALALLLTAGAVPDGMGGWDNGSRDPIPTSSSILRWRYDKTFDALWRDRIMFGVASVDYDLPSVRLLYSISDSPSPIQFTFDLAEGPPSPACTDGVPGGCELATTTCGTWGANVNAVGADGITRLYRICSMFRVLVRVANIEESAARNNLLLSDYAHRVIRHEVGHVLGLRHSVATLDSESSPCARAMVEAFVTDDDPAWTAVPAPEACQ